MERKAPNPQPAHWGDPEQSDAHDEEGDDDEQDSE